MSIQKNVRILFVFSVVLAFGIRAAAADDLCGATVVVNVKLDHDLACAGDGLIVGVDGIKIDLNGHTITGSGTGSGILASGRSGVVIMGGTIRSFLIGVQLAASTGTTVKQIQVTGARDGIFLIGSSGNTIKENTAWQNSRVGIMLRPGAVRNSTQNLVVENVLSDNANGIILVQTPTENVFKENRISGSSTAGIALNGGVSANLLKENTFTGNVSGILFNVVDGLLPSANIFAENLIIANSCGLTGPTSGNTFKEDVLLGNGADSCP